MSKCTVLVKEKNIVKAYRKDDDVYMDFYGTILYKTAKRVETAEDFVKELTSYDNPEQFSNVKSVEMVMLVPPNRARLYPDGISEGDFFKESNMLRGNSTVLAPISGLFDEFSYVVYIVDFDNDSFEAYQVDEEKGNFTELKEAVISSVSETSIDRTNLEPFKIATLSIK